MNRIRFALTVLYFAVAAVAIGGAFWQALEANGRWMDECRKAGGTPVSARVERLCLSPGVVLPLRRDR